MQDFLKSVGHNMVTISLEQIKWVHYAGFFTVSQYVFLVLMVAIGATPMPLPLPFPFFHQVQAAEQLACTCGKRGRGRGRGTIVSVCTKLCSRVAPKLLSSTLFSCEFCVPEHGPYQF